jgi:hypothetical protein
VPGRVLGGDTLVAKLRTAYQRFGGTS